MTDDNIALPTALHRALELVADPPRKPDVSKGYLDLLGARPVENTALSKITGAAPALFTLPVVAMVYDNTQAIMRKLFPAFQPPLEWLNIPPGGVVLDVGCGPGNVTALLARAAGPGGLALGLDFSEAMLARAVRAEAGPQIGFLRADAQRLPFRAESFDAVSSIAVLQLIPDPVAAVAEMARVLKPGGRLVVMAPTAGRAARFWRKLPNFGATVFGEDELGDILQDHGLVSVRTKHFGTLQWARGNRV